jgi:hypothetical protein
VGEALVKLGQQEQLGGHRHTGGAGYL